MAPLSSTPTSVSAVEIAWKPAPTAPGPQTSAQKVLTCADLHEAACHRHNTKDIGLRCLRSRTAQTKNVAIPLRIVV